jgi:hypothetical protein
MSTMTATLTVAGAAPTRTEEFILDAAARLQRYVARRMLARVEHLRRDLERTRAFDDARDAMLRQTLARGL